MWRYRCVPFTIRRIADLLGAMDAAELLERAHHYRMMALRVTDAQTREGLLELAERYEAWRARWSRRGAIRMISEALTNALPTRRLSTATAIASCISC
jgi:hypothetical protein